MAAPVSSERLCKFPRCERRHDAKGYCQSHYRQFSAGKDLKPLKAGHRPKSKVECDRCGHVFYPRTAEHKNKCCKCRGRFNSDLSLLREKSRAAPPGRRWCQGCDKYRAVKFFPGSSARCRPCFKTYSADQRAQKTYSLPPGAYMELYNHQGGKCYICQRATGARRSLSVDHDHLCCAGETSCGKCVRGLLCGGCNYKILGHLRDDIDALNRAVKYLTDPPARAVLKRTLD